MSVNEISNTDPTSNTNSIEEKKPLTPRKDQILKESTTSNTLNIQNSSESNNSYLSGYLLKKTKAGHWQKRYFETNNNGFLAYYKSKRKEKLLAALSLPQTGEIRIITKDEIFDHKTNKQIVGLFSIELNSRVYLLQAKTNEEAYRWVQTLNKLKYQSLPNTHNTNANTTSNLLHTTTTSNTTSTIPIININDNNAHSSLYREPLSATYKADWKKTYRSSFEYFCCF